MKTFQWMSRATCATALAAALCTTTANAQPITQGYDAMPAAGWFFQNNSSPLGVIGWFQGNAGVFPSQAGAANAYAGVNFNSGSGLATISNWMISPETDVNPGSIINFYARSIGSVFPDRMQVRISTAGASTNVGTAAEDLGVFATLVLDINPNYAVGGFPNVWTQHNIVLTPAQVPAPGRGRVAFRYYQTNGGPSGGNGDYAGIDTFNYTPGATNNCLLPLPTGCPANVNTTGPSATVVDVSDLLAVINGWGQTGPPRPAADCAPMPNGDCTVNVQDLLAVINGWGNCIPATGRCCQATCTDGLTLAQCNALGGLWGGAATVCAGFVCPIANDNCTGAFTLNATVVPPSGLPTANNGTNAGATDSPGTVSCTSPITRDVWYKHTVPTTPGLLGQQLRLNLCTTAAPFTDTVLVLYEGTCAALTEVACNDDSCGLLSEINTTTMLNPGAQLYIRVGSWSTAATNQGQFILRALVTNITSDVCDGAEVLPIGGSDTDTLGGATQDFGPSCTNVGCSPPGTVSASVGRWYKTVGNGQTLTVSTCTSVTGVYDGKISIYCAPNCGALNCKAASDCDIGTPQLPACPAFQGERVSFCSTLGQTYFILVGAQNIPGGETAPYTVTLTGGATCTNSPAEVCGPPPPPINDDCTSPLPITVGATNFNNASATPVVPVAWCGTVGGMDLWFTYTSANGGTVKLQVTGVAPYTDGIMSVYTPTSTCAALTEISCVDDPTGVGTCTPACGGCHPCIEFTAAAGATYRIRIGSWNSAGNGAGTITVTDP